METPLGLLHSKIFPKEEELFNWKIIIVRSRFDFFYPLHYFILQKNELLLTVKSFLFSFNNQVSEAGEFGL